MVAVTFYGILLFNPHPAHSNTHTPNLQAVDLYKVVQNVVKPYQRPIFPDRTAIVAAQKAVEKAADAPPAPQVDPNINLSPNTSYTAPTQAYGLPNNAAKAFIYMHESGNNPGAINASSGACGLGQALPCSKMPCSLSDYACQDNFFTGYAISRYGSWSAAYGFWIAHSWW